MEQAGDRADGRPGAKRRDSAERLFVVRVTDRCCEHLTGHGGGSYLSPPQRLEAARALVALLAGRGDLDEMGCGVVRIAVPGGSRTITLAEVGA